MIRYLLHRLGQSVVLLWLVSMIGFGLLHLTPGGPLSQFSQAPGMTQEDLQRIAHQMGLDRPLPMQYLEWLAHLLTGDWGRSYRDSQPVLWVIASHLGATLELMISSTLLAVLLGTWVGVLGAIRRYSLFDYASTAGAMVALSIPTFWFGLVVIYLFSVTWRLLPAGNIATIGDGSLLDYLPSPDRPGHRAGPGHRRDLEPLHALLRARRDQPGLRPHRPRQRPARARGAASTTCCATRCCR